MTHNSNMYFQHAKEEFIITELQVVLSAIFMLPARLCVMCVILCRADLDLDTEAPSTKRPREEVDVSMAALAKGEVKQVHCYFPC